MDGNDLPTDMVLSKNTIPDFEPTGFVVGALSAIDEDGDPLDFSLVSGGGDDDNVRFVISGTDLISGEGSDFSVQPKYRVLVQANDGRGGFVVAPFEISVQELLGLLDLAKMGVTISPNPTQQDLNIKIANKATGEGQLSIASIEGKDILRFNFQKESFMHKEKLDLSTLTKGVYILSVQIGDRCAKGRFVKY